MPKIRVGKRLRPLMAHQEEGVTYGMTRRHLAYFMQMRLGKTLTTIRWARKKSLRRCLVLAPKTVLDSWAEELEREGEDFILCVSESDRRRAKAIAEAWELGSSRRCWLLLNYEALLAMGEVHDILQTKKWKALSHRTEGLAWAKEMKAKRQIWRRVRDVPEVAYAPWDLVALDESTKIKNPAAQLTKICVQGFRTARHRAVLSGLPAPESDLDLFCQMQFLHGKFMDCTNWYQFRDKYFDQGFDGSTWYPKPGMKSVIKKVVHTLAFVRTRKQCGLPDGKLPPVKRYLTLPPHIRKIYDKVEAEYAIELQSGEIKSTQWKLAQRMWMRKLAGGFDSEEHLLSGFVVDELIYLLKGEFSQEKVVVWCSFQHEVNYVIARLAKAKIPATFIHGGVTAKGERRRRRELFQGKTYRVMVATPDVAKYGLDFSAANIAIYLSNSESCEARTQSEDRIVHPHKKEPLVILNFVVKDTVSEDILELVQNKSFDAKMLMTRLDLRLLQRRKPQNGQDTEKKATRAQSAQTEGKGQTSGRTDRPVALRGRAVSASTAPKAGTGSQAQAQDPKASASRARHSLLGRDPLR